MGFNGCVLIMDHNQERRSRLEAILSFMQVQWRSGSRANDLAWLREQLHTMTVLLGETDFPPDELMKNHGHHVFITLSPCRSKAANLLGTLSELTYDELTRLLGLAEQWRPKAESQQHERCLKEFLVGESPAMQSVKGLIRQVADKQANVLLLGESGTGKEVIARAIHSLSQQADGPFVPINCGAIPAELLESELFGHEKGAFTGAVSARKGRFELADGGTLFLDEIGDMPLPMQVKLLRVLQERSFERVGGTRPIKANVRVIAATHRDLEVMIGEQRFREDLYYRLNVFPITAPPLRERREDLPLLLTELVSRHRSEHRVELGFSPAAVQTLQGYRWPGNVRELSNLVERMMILRPNQQVEPGDLPEKYRGDYVPESFDEMDEQAALASIFADEPATFDEEGATFFDFDSEEDTPASNGDWQVPDFSSEGVNLKEMLATIEVDMIGKALDAHDGVVARAAEHLGMRRTTLVEKMKKYGIGRD
ncbi:FleQ protein [Oceanimonas sp. GK1]|uniref:sigma-54 dependent transcriptional regulator n=1 Tax=Oceanimonas sp. (strain GK1 / IBRC-M 10197) TaxID=511062 RepID=UPI000249547C|nr:FleQ protein [Oceanimonas sp. GK1]